MQNPNPPVRPELTAPSSARRDSEGGSVLLEAVIVGGILAAVFAGLCRLGAAALSSQQRQLRTDTAAWSAAIGQPVTGGPQIERELLGTRARWEKAVSYRIDLASDR